jgi:hypothetical protein
MNMKRVNGVLTLFAVLSVAQFSSAQSYESEPLSPESVAEESEEVSRVSGSVTLNQDAFFGFYPVAAGAYTINDLVDFTFYSIIWTIPAFGAGGGGGGLWTEFGVGASFNFLDGDLSINPQIGLLNGSLLSGGLSDGAIRAADGVVPNLTVTYDGEHLEGQFYFGLYLGARGDKNLRNDYVHYWTYAGVRPLAFTNSPAAGLLTIGMHWEQLRFMGIASGADADNVYRWIGPYVSLALPGSISMRFAAGANLDNPSGPAGFDFYKLTVGMDF